MAKKELKLHPVVAPSEIVVVSAYDEDGRADACTLAFYMVSGLKPLCVTIAVNAEKKRKTLKSMRRKNAFTLAFPGTDQIRETDYLGVESGYNTDKLKNLGWTVSRAKTVHAPLINEMRLSLECEIIHTVTIGSHIHITGEVRRILADESILNDNDSIVLEKLKPIIYDEEQLRYLGIGTKQGDAYKTGAALKKEMAGLKDGSL